MELIWSQWKVSITNIYGLYEMFLQFWFIINLTDSNILIHSETIKYFLSMFIEHLA
jgi:hypothetical protein